MKQSWIIEHVATVIRSHFSSSLALGARSSQFPWSTVLEAVDSGVGAQSTGVILGADKSHNKNRTAFLAICAIL